MPTHARALVSGLAAVAVVLASLAALDLTASAQPGRAFRNSDLRGDYAFAGVNCCVLGQFTADGAGGITGTLTLAGGKDVHHESLTCTYSVNPNGTGTMTCDTQKLDGPDKGSTSTGGTSDIVLADGGREMFGINTDLGGEVEGLISIARRQ
jgi:hypothetical protein